MILERHSHRLEDYPTPILLRIPDLLPVVTFEQRITGINVETRAKIAENRTVLVFRRKKYQRSSTEETRGNPTSSTALCANSD